MTSDAEELRDQVRRHAAKAGAAVGGFLEGFREGIEKEQVAQHARAAAESVVRVIREAAAAARDEMRKGGAP